MDDRLRHVLDSHQLSCGAVIAASGEVVAQEGDFGAFASAGLVSALLGPYGSAKATFDSLEGRLLPRMWRQGEEFAFVDKPTAELAVVVFGRGRDYVSELLALSKQVGRSIREEFGEEPA
jgi:hypothetical protein